MPSNIKFKHYDWKKIAWVLGMELVERKGEDAVILRKPGEWDRRWMMSENGGELNVTEIVYKPLEESVPYWDNTKAGGAVGPWTLADRIARAMAREPIDFDRNEDTELTAGIEPPA